MYGCQSIKNDVLVSEEKKRIRFLKNDVENGPNFARIKQNKKTGPDTINLNY